MRKTTEQICAERRQEIDERRKYLTENPEIYRRDYDEAVKNYLTSRYTELGLDPEDCDNRFDPKLREEFAWSPKGRELAIKYSYNCAWDPGGDKPPSPVVLSSIRVIRCQDDRILLNQIQKDSIINLAPYNVFVRFLILEIDLTYPSSEIKADIMAWVDDHWKDLETFGFDRKLIERPKPRNRGASFKYKKMEVWEMIENERQSHSGPPEDDLHRAMERYTKWLDGQLILASVDQTVDQVTKKGQPI